MIDLELERFRQILGRYSPELVQQVAERTSRFSRSRKIAEPIDRIVANLSTKKTLEKLVSCLDESELRAFSVFSRLPGVFLRWDVAVRLLAEFAIGAPYRVLQTLLNEGMLVLLYRQQCDALARFSINPDAPAEELPEVGIAAPVVRAALAVGEPLFPQQSNQPEIIAWRRSDGWEFPLRLALLWRLAAQAPIKRTQQKILFKRDQERLGGNSLLSSPLAEGPAEVPDFGLLCYETAARMGWLDWSAEEQVALDRLVDLYRQPLRQFLGSCASNLVGVEAWNELGEDALRALPLDGRVARALVLVWLASLDPDRALALDEVVSELCSRRSLWNEPQVLASGIQVSTERYRAAEQWVRTFLLGVLYQCGVVEHSPAPDDRHYIRLTPSWQAQALAEDDGDPPAPVARTLLVQPNHEVIVYRQGLNLPLVAGLMTFCEPKSLGAALLFEINAGSVFFGLEQGLSAEEMKRFLEEASGRDLPDGVAQSIRTWSQKREQIQVFPAATILEFQNAADLELAVSRGIAGIVLSEKILVVTSSEHISESLRIIATRDYRFEGDRCVDVEPDGVSLNVDLGKSDLLLESEMNRFADPIEEPLENGRKRYRITSDSLRRSFEKGLGGDFVKEWFEKRTGQAPPPSVMLLVHSCSGHALDAGNWLVLHTRDPVLADGLMQHPETRDLISQRLGPNAVAVDPHKAEFLTQVLERMGLTVRITTGDE